MQSRLYTNNRRDAITSLHNTCYWFMIFLGAIERIHNCEKIISVLYFSENFTAMAEQQRSATVTGAVIGAVVGGLIGAFVGNVPGAVVGAVNGGVVGAGL